MEDVIILLETIPPFVVGFTGSLHCLGMCGPLVMAWSLRYKTASKTGAGNGGPFPLFYGAFLHHVAFHAGRIAAYGVLGSLVAGLFGSLEVRTFSMQYRAGLAIVSGFALIALGLVLWKVLPLPRYVVRLFSPRESGFGMMLARLAGSGSLGSKAALGILAGFLPCGLTWAMFVVAAGTLSFFRGFVTMAAFGLGTVPALVIAGVSASLLSVRTRILGERVAAAFVMIMGVSIAVRGLGAIVGFEGHCGPMGLLTGSGLLR